MTSDPQSVSPDPGGAAVPERPSARGVSRLLARPHGWGWAVPVVLAVTGAVFAASALTAHGTDLRSGRRTGLTDLVLSSEKKVRSVDQQVAALQSEVQELTASAGGGADLRAASERAEQLAGPAGLTAVSGPALTVTLDDAPRGQAGVDGVVPDAEVSPDDLVVHQEDVQAVVNALWAGGAEAMSLMDQRVISTSAVRCVGNTLILQGRVYSPPFTVTAIGDTTRMREALDASPGVTTYRQFVDAVGLGYQVKDEKETTLPPFEGSLRVPGALTDATGGRR